MDIKDIHKFASLEEAMGSENVHFSLAEMFALIDLVRKSGIYDNVGERGAFGHGFEMGYTFAKSGENKNA